MSGCPFRRVQRDPGRFHLATDHRHPRLRQLQPRASVYQASGQRRQPPLNCCALALLEDGVEVSLDQTGCP
jgi:hypothetical protein